MWKIVGKCGKVGKCGNTYRKIVKHIGKLWKTYETYGKIGVEPANVGKHGIYKHEQKTKTYETYYGKMQVEAANFCKWVQNDSKSRTMDVGNRSADFNIPYPSLS
jgi:hypothetical protein